MSSDQRTDLVHGIRDLRLFRDLPEEALAVIADQATRGTCYRGQTIIEEGENDDSLMVLLRGRVAVQVESISPYFEVPITRLGSGDIIGEMSMVDGSPRSASVIALEAGEFVRIPGAFLREFLDGNPQWGYQFMKNMNGVLSERLRLMNRRVLNMMRFRHY